MNAKLTKTIETFAQNENFSNYDITELNAGSSKGDGFLGEMKTFTITGKNKNNETKIIKCFVKSAPFNDDLRNSVPVAKIYRQEIFMYDTIVPIFKNLVEEKGLTPFTFAPKYYGSVLEDKYEALIFENLRVSGYGLHEHNCSMNDNHVTLVLTTYGRYHALSFALRNQQEAKFNKIIENLPDLFCNNIMSIMGNSMIGLSNKALALLDVKTESQTVKKFEEFINNIEAFLDELKVSLQDEHTVILHGDCWTNNMMFQYGDPKDLKKPTGVRLLDYQMARLGYPVLDLVFFFYACSSLNVIQSVDHYKDIYYNSLSEYLQKLGSDPKKLYPRAIFEDQFRKFAKCALMLVPMVIQVASSEKNEFMDFETALSSGIEVQDVFNYELANSNLFNTRMRAILKHFVEKDLL